MGIPPQCRPECSTNYECALNLACQNQKCVDPCPGVCGYNAICSVRNHIPTCECPVGMIGNAFTACSIPPPQSKNKFTFKESFIILIIYASPVTIVNDDPCYPSPCGLNAICQNGHCSCPAEFIGDPYSKCQPECILNSECPSNKACINQKCKDPCPGTCASNAICEVINHIAMCRCAFGMIGNAFVHCEPTPSKLYLYSSKRKKS